jgi:hypothetical protein
VKVSGKWREKEAFLNALDWRTARSAPAPAAEPEEAGNEHNEG